MSKHYEKNPPCSMANKNAVIQCFDFIWFFACVRLYIFTSKRKQRAQRRAQNIIRYQILTPTWFICLRHIETLVTVFVMLISHSTNTSNSNYCRYIVLTELHTKCHFIANWLLSKFHLLNWFIEINNWKEIPRNLVA